MKIHNKNLLLFFALAIPVLLIIIIALSIYIPGIGKHPHYSFVYETGSGEYLAPSYIVQGSKITTAPPLQYPNAINVQQATSTLYEYDIERDSAKQITLQEAQAMNLDSSNISPDGYQISYGNSNGGIFPFIGLSDYSDTQYLKGHNRSIRLNLKLGSASYGYGNFQFLGWILH